MRRPLALTAAALPMIAVNAALAHTQGTASDDLGLMHGLTHPMLGLDHLLAMLAVGILAARCVKRSQILIAPASFVALMAAGAGIALLGVTSSALVGAEWMITTSLLAFGLLIAVMPRINAYAAAIIVGLFATAHGYAHISELHGSVIGYTTGMLVGTALLHVAGIAMGLGLMKLPTAAPLRLSGAAIAAVGLALTLGVM